ncbi:DNA repair protein RAD51 homolog 4-like [Ciona intestinalis]
MPSLLAGLCPALTQDVIVKLESKGIKEVLDFVSIDPERITAMCGIPYKKVMSIRRVLLAQYSSFPVNGLDLFHETMSTLAVLPTECESLDDLLDAGIYTGEVTEIVGPSSSGKTQLCETFAVNVAASFDQNVVYVDTAGGFSAARVEEIFKKRFPSHNASATLSRIRVSRCFEVSELREILDLVRRKMSAQDETFFSSLKVVIIDSVTSLLSTVLYNGSFVEGMASLQSIGRQLNALAKDFALAVVITNDMVTGPQDKTGQFSRKPALGRVWTFVPSVRVQLQPHIAPCLHHMDMNKILARLTKSTRCGYRATSCVITSSGIESEKLT